MYVVRDTKNGILVINPKDRFLGHCLDTCGEFSPQECSLLMRLLSYGDVAVDIGANIGALTVPMARTRATVIAIEPQRLIFQMLCANIVMNGLLNVYAYQKAVGAALGQITVPVLNPEEIQNFGGLELSNDKEGEIVPVITVDSLSLDKCTLMKIDVEGYENEVIHGAQATIAKCKPLLYVENDRIPKSKELIETIQELGYDCWWHIPVLSPNAENEFSQIASTNMLCCHKSNRASMEKLIPSYSLEEVIDSSYHPMERK